MIYGEWESTANMAIDLRHKHKKASGRKDVKSDDVYLRLLVKLYRFLHRRTGSDFNRVVLKRLIMSRKNKPPVSLKKLIASLKGREDKIAVVVGTVTDDVRVYDVPKITLATLRISETARARIVKNGGEVITIDQLALRAPKGSNTVLVRGAVTAREAEKHFGAPGIKGHHAKPYVGSKGRNRA